MLNLSGNSEQTFASSDSIQIANVVYAEWNYNNIERPYVVSPNSSFAISSASVLLNPNNWNSLIGSQASAIPNAGFYSTTDPAASAINLTTGSGVETIYSSPSIQLISPAVAQPNSYYKLVFYIKANQPVISIAASGISGSSVNGGGLNVHTPVRVATNGSLSASYSSGVITSSFNGAISIDGISLSLNDRVLVKNQTTTSQNGIYTVTSVGSVSTKWVLTRASDNNNSASSNNSFGDTVYVTSGTTNANQIFTQTNFGSSTQSGILGTITLDTDAIIYNLNSTGLWSSYSTQIGPSNASYDNRSPWPGIIDDYYSSSYSEVYPFYGSNPTDVYYRIVPINPDGSRPPKDIDYYDINLTYVNQSGSYGGIITWTNNNNCVAYDIYRGSSPQSVTYIATIQNPGYQVTPYYIDNFNMLPVAIDSLPLQSTQVRIIPRINMYSNGTPIEYNNQYVKIYTDPFEDADINRGIISIDGVNYQKIEVFFGSQQVFDSVVVNIDVNSFYQNTSVYMYRPEIYAIDQWDFFVTQYYPIEQLFSSNRPGEALLNPFIQYKDTIINTAVLSPSAQHVKPVSYAAYNPDYFFGNIDPYKQMYDSNLNNVVRFWVGNPSASIGMPASAAIFAKYNNYMNINKIVIKGSNAFTDMTQSSGSVTIYTSAGSTVVPFGPTNGSATFAQSGLFVLYYNGSSWTTARPTVNYPPVLSDSGVVENMVPNVYAMSFTIQNVNQANPNLIGTLATPRVQMIEISPRLEIDISDHIVGIEVDTTIDNSNSANGFPIGYINSNTAKITINNIPVYKNNFPHTIWEPFATNIATFSNLIRQNVKFTGAIKSIDGSFTDTIPLFCMYSNDWNPSGMNEISVDVYDAAKAIMMVLNSPDYFGENENMFQTVTNIFDAVGFSDYDYDGLKQIMSRRATNTTHFWCDRTSSLYDSIRGFFVAHQIGAYFDPYGIMRFEDLDSIIAKYYDNIPANFLITDIDYAFTNSAGSSVHYRPNITTQNNLSETINPKIGQITLNYTIPLRAFTYGLNSENNSTQQDQPYTLWSETGNSGVVYSYADASMLSTDRTFYSLPERTNMMSPNTTPKYTLGGETADAFMQGELINWAGLEYRFTPALGLNNAPLTPLYSQGYTEIVATPADLQNYINDFSNQDPRISQVMFNFTGNALGVSRGQRFTSVRNHYMYHSDQVISGYNSSIDLYWNRYTVSATGLHKRGDTVDTTYATNVHDAVFDHNVVHMLLNKAPGNNTSLPVIVGPKKNTADIGELNVPMAASSFNYFSFVFAAPNYADIKESKWKGSSKSTELGLYIDTTNGPFVLIVGNYKNTSFLNTGYPSNYQIHGEEGVGVDIPVANVYDGKAHRITCLFTVVPSALSPAQQSSTGVMSYNYITIWIDGVKYGPYRIWSNGAPVTVVPKSTWGFSGRNAVLQNSGVAAPQKATLYEEYSCLWFDSKGIYISPAITPWHWQTTYFLDGIMGMNPAIEPPYFYWGPLHVTGVKFYDNVQFSTSPAYPNSISYEYAGYDPGDQPNVIAPTLSQTSRSSISTSTLITTPFRARFAVVNSDTEVVFLSTADNQVNNSQFSAFQLQGFYGKLTDTLTIQKIIDSNNVLNSIQLTTPWIQSNYDAEQLMVKLALLSHAFNATMTITIFGNPLVEVGDVCQMIFTQKGIGWNPDTNQVIPTFFYVSGTQQKISNDTSSGLETDLTLIPMIYIPS